MNKKAFHLVGLLVLALAVLPGVHAQEETKADTVTKVEQFLSQRGTLLIKDFYEIGSLQGTLSTSATVQAVVITTSGARVRGVKFTRPTTSKYGRDQTGFIDEEELAEVIKSIDVITAEAERLKGQKVEYKEVIFKTRGGVSLGFFQAGSKQNAFFQVNSSDSSDAIVFGEINLLKHLKVLLEKAQARLQEAVK